MTRGLNSPKLDSLKIISLLYYDSSIVRALRLSIVSIFVWYISQTNVFATSPSIISLTISKIKHYKSKSISTYWMLQRVTLSLWAACQWTNTARRSSSHRYARDAWAYRFCSCHMRPSNPPSYSLQVSPHPMSWVRVPGPSGWSASNRPRGRHLLSSLVGEGEKWGDFRVES